MPRMEFVGRVCLLLFVSMMYSLALAGDWPAWRGPDRTDVSEETGLLQSWPEGGPSKVWVSDAAGLGYSGMAVVGDTIYTMGAVEREEFLIAINVADGSRKWATPIGPRLKNGWGDGPRGTPTVDGDYVYALGGEGDLVCCKAATGETVWDASMRDLGGSIPDWGYTESVLVDGEKLLCTPGGDEGTIAAFNKLNGEILWRSKGFTEKAHYSSIIAIEHNGVRQYVQLTESKLAGVDAKTGEQLWSMPWNGRTAVIPTPIYRDGHVYVSSGYGAGCMLVKLTDVAAEQVYKNENMKNHHGGVLLLGDHVYGHSDKVGWVCQDFKTGEIVWRDKEVLGKGAVTYADGRLYCVDEGRGTVVLADASPSGWEEHGRFTIDPQTTQRADRGMIWTHPTVANGKLYLRDQELILCYDIKAK